MGSYQRVIRLTGELSLSNGYDATTAMIHWHTNNYNGPRFIDILLKRDSPSFSSIIEKYIRNWYFLFANMFDFWLYNWLKVYFVIIKLLYLHVKDSAYSKFFSYCPKAKEIFMKCMRTWCVNYLPWTNI